MDLGHLRIDHPAWAAIQTGWSIPRAFASISGAAPMLTDSAIIAQDYDSLSHNCRPGTVLGIPSNRKRRLPRPRISRNVTECNAIQAES
jgi:hypothetical protein